jgi:hypothetical protein
MFFLGLANAQSFLDSTSSSSGRCMRCPLWLVPLEGSSVVLFSACATIRSSFPDSRRIPRNPMSGNEIGKAANEVKRMFPAAARRFSQLAQAGIGGPARVGQRAGRVVPRLFFQVISELGDHALGQVTQQIGGFLVRFGPPGRAEVRNNRHGGSAFRWPQVFYTQRIRLRPMTLFNGVSNHQTP